MGFSARFFSNRTSLVTGGTRLSQRQRFQRSGADLIYLARAIAIERAVAESRAPPAVTVTQAHSLVLMGINTMRYRSADF